MKRAYWYIGIGLALQIFLCVSPFIPYVRTNIWASQTSVNQFASTLATYLGIQMLIIGALFSLALLDFKTQTSETLKEYTPLHVQRLKESEFYKDFLGSCVRARHYVKICYFAPNPPEHGAPRERDAYYRRLASVVKQNPTTVFKRIIRDTPENRVWAQRLAKTFAKTTNCSIALLNDLAQGTQMPLALSVQIVDGDDAWLVAVGEHGGADMYRDLGIHNKVIAEVLDKYFDRLWNQSTIVFEPGYTLDRVERIIRERA